MYITVDTNRAISSLNWKNCLPRPEFHGRRLPLSTNRAFAKKRFFPKEKGYWTVINMEHNALTHEHLQRNQKITLAGPANILIQFLEFHYMVYVLEKQNEWNVYTFFGLSWTRKPFGAQHSNFCSKKIGWLFFLKIITILKVDFSVQLILEILKCISDAFLCMKLSVPNSLFICKSIFYKYFPVCFRWPFLRNLFFKTRNLYFISLHVSSPVSRGCLSISEGSSWKSPVFEGKLVCKTIQSPQFKRNSPVFSWKQYFFSKKKGRHHVTCWHTLFFWLSFFWKRPVLRIFFCKRHFLFLKKSFLKKANKIFFGIYQLGLSGESLPWKWKFAFLKKIW